MLSIAYVALAIIACYVALALLLFAFQRKLLYRPLTDRIPLSAAEMPKDVREVEFATADGKKIVCWHLPPALGRPTILYFHGNGGGLIHRRERFLRCASAGFGLFMAIYRGYSGSSGAPSEARIIADALEIYDHVAQTGQPVILYGESLGSGVAVQVAVRRTPAAVILEAPYTSITDVAQRLYPIMPVRPFLMDRFDSMAVIGDVRVPILVVHGVRDMTIPVSLGQRLFEAAPQPKSLVILPQAGHNDLYAHGAWGHIREFVERVVAIKPQAIDASA